MNLPEKFLEHARQFAGKDYDAFISSLSNPVQTSIRLNPFKLTEQFSTEENLPWSQHGKFLKDRPSFTLDPLFHAGCYYVQDSSSQFLEKPFLQIKNTNRDPLIVLDLCAAPGGKSTHILSMLQKEDILVSNEVISSRNNILRDNIFKWGCSNVIVTQNEPKDFLALKNYFDVIVVDAPCSGEGLFRKDPDAVNEWSEENVNRCSIRQSEILSHAFQSLKPGGFLIYSTCTFEKVENDDKVQMMMDEYNLIPISMDTNFAGITNTGNGFTFFPHLNKGEGFFISLLQKQGELSTTHKRQERKKEKLSVYAEQFLSDSDEFFTLNKEERTFLIPHIHAGTFRTMAEKLYVRLAGIYLGDVKGNFFIPSAGLSLSNHIRKDIASVELAKDQAIKFLRGEPIKIDSPIGWTLARYKGFNLGWMKNLGDRTNNYYPKEWRIRKG